MNTRSIKSAALFGAVFLAILTIFNFLLPVTAAAQAAKAPIIYLNQA